MRSRRPGYAAAVAPAKLNLFLHIIGQRADGYHLLESLAAFTQVGDVVTARKRSHESQGTSLRVSGPQKGALKNLAPHKNLLLKAHQWFEAKTASAYAVAWTLRKNLPTASGIGGGSSDAATAVHLLQLLFEHPAAFAVEDLVTLGADVPVCYQRHTSLMQGVGEHLQPFTALSWPVVLINPGFAIETQAIFQAYHQQNEENYTTPLPLHQLLRDDKALASFLQEYTQNDLQPVVCALYPQVERILQSLAAQKDCWLVRLSGSGATCFGIFTKQGAADKAAKELKRLWPESWVVSTRMI